MDWSQHTTFLEHHSLKKYCQIHKYYFVSSFVFEFYQYIIFPKTILGKYLIIVEYEIKKKKILLYLHSPQPKCIS